MPIDYSEYPPNWKTEIRPAVLKRAKNCCENCGVPNYALIYRPNKGKPDWELAPEGHQADAMALDGVKFVKIVLTIAHLNHDIKQNNLVNLKALCQRCHLNYDKVFHKSNRIKNRATKQKQTNLFN